MNFQRHANRGEIRAKKRQVINAGGSGGNCAAFREAHKEGSESRADTWHHSRRQGAVWEDGDEVADKKPDLQIGPRRKHPERMGASA